MARPRAGAPATRPADGPTITEAAAAVVRAFIGPATDGALVFDGTSTVAGLVPSGGVYQLNRDLRATTLVVNSGVTIKTNGWRVLATVSILNNGRITSSGIQNVTPTSFGGGAPSSQTVGMSTGGANGGTGNGTGTTALSRSLGGQGGTGGGANGGVGGSVTAPPANEGGADVMGSLPHALSGRGLTGQQLVGGTGGGSGVGDGTNAGGGGGCGGGGNVMAAPTITNNGRIDADGTDGTGNGGNTSGGAGGGAGFFSGTYAQWVGNLPTAKGGNGGLGSGTGATGAKGADGRVFMNKVAP